MKILLLTDGSRHSLAAARALSGWFAWPGGSVDVLAVTPEEPQTEGREFGRDTERDQGWRSTIRRWLDETTSRLAASGLRTRQMTRRGDPAEVVLDAASEGYDLIVVGAKGRADEPFLNEDSVARAVLEHAPTSVLVVRERMASGRQRPLPTTQRPLRVLFAVDGAGAADAAVEAYSSLAPVEHTSLAVLAVADAAEGGLLGEPDARKVAHRIASELAGHGWKVEQRVVAGAAASTILAAAEGADLVVMGSRASREPGATRLGSVGLEVARETPCSLLIVREAAPVSFIEEEEAEEAAVTPFEIAYEGVESSSAVERHVLRGMKRLERVSPDLIAAHVTVAAHDRRHVTGNLYDVRLTLALPGPDVVISRTPPPHRQDEDLVLAIGEAFDKARRQLIDRYETERAELRSREEMPHGEVTDLFPDHGFIRASEGRIVYFHRNSVAHEAWDELEVGAQVGFRDELGDEGPQATIVTVGRPPRWTLETPSEGG
jgi:nucleotide-binding universal stress UspA family protein/ribosome-associated translation inhibitor RaiA/cold shock CspA family protein